MQKKMSLLQQKKLVGQALEARRHAYAPYSHFAVGAALLCADGSVFTGCNIENQSYPAGICAERAALAAAVSQGKRGFAAIAVAGGDAPVTPCGICRQALAEFGEMEVICSSVQGDFFSIFLSELLPHSFRLAGGAEKQ